MPRWNPGFLWTWVGSGHWATLRKGTIGGKNGEVRPSGTSPSLQDRNGLVGCPLALEGGASGSVGETRATGALSPWPSCSEQPHLSGCACRLVLSVWYLGGLGGVDSPGQAAGGAIGELHWGGGPPAELGWFQVRSDTPLPERSEETASAPPPPSALLTPLCTPAPGPLQHSAASKQLVGARQVQGGSPSMTTEMGFALLPCIQDPASLQGLNGGPSREVGWAGGMLSLPNLPWAFREVGGGGRRGGGGGEG